MPPPSAPPLERGGASLPLQRGRRRSCAGFSLLELVAAIGIVFVLAAMAQPLLKNKIQRHKERELAARLRQIRAAIDAFHQDWRVDQGRIVGPYCLKDKAVCREVSSHDGYPKKWDVLLRVDFTDEEKKKAAKREAGEGQEPAAVPRESRTYLRDVLRTDPITRRAWQFRCYDDPIDATAWCGTDIYDVRSTSQATALDGSQYRDW